MEYIAVLLVAVVWMWAAMLWFGPLFWDLWMKIHGWENMSKKELKKQQKWMEKYMALEAINTFIMVWVLAFILGITTAYSPYLVAFLLWIGFLYPIVVSAVIWGADNKKWYCHKIAVLAGFNLVFIMLAAFLLTFWK